MITPLSQYLFYSSNLYTIYKGYNEFVFVWNKFIILNYILLLYLFARSSRLFSVTAKSQWNSKILRVTRVFIKIYISCIMMHVWFYARVCFTTNFIYLWILMHIIEIFFSRKILKCKIWKKKKKMSTFSKTKQKDINR